MLTNVTLAYLTKWNTVSAPKSLSLVGWSLGSHLRIRKPKKDRPGNILPPSNMHEMRNFVLEALEGFY